MDRSDNKTRVGTPAPRSRPPERSGGIGSAPTPSATPAAELASGATISGAHVAQRPGPGSGAYDAYTAPATPATPATPDTGAAPWAPQLPAMPPPQDTLLGTTISNRYHIDKKLGEGGMGSVYLARHVTLDKQVALKVLHGEFARKPDLVERFLQEARAASRIRHENVIDITDFGATPDGLVYFAMEVLEGVDLHDVLARERHAGRRLPWERTRKIFLQICSALAAAHAKGIVHRDLKPENIYLVEWLGHADFVKLLDFGIAKLTEVSDSDRKLTRTGMLFGTPEYMSPEQARGDKVDHRVDVYAMGCILHQMLTGVTPFQAENFMGVLSMHLTEPPPVIAPEVLVDVGAPAGLAAVVTRALEKDRDRRFQTIEEMAGAILALEDGEVPPAFVHPATVRPPSRPPSGSWGPAPAPTPVGAVGAVATQPGHPDLAQPTPAPHDDAAGGSPTAQVRVSGSGPAPAAVRGPGDASRPPHSNDRAARGSGEASRPPRSDDRAGDHAGRRRTEWTGRVALPDEDAPPAPARRRTGWIAAGLLVLAVGGGAAAYVATRGDQGAGSAAAPGPNAGSPGADEAAAAGAAVPDEVLITLRSEPPEAEVLDARGAVVGITPMRYSMRASSEPRVFRVRLAGYADGILELVPDRDGEHTVTLQPAPGARADAEDAPGREVDRADDRGDGAHGEAGRARARSKPAATRARARDTDGAKDSDSGARRDRKPAPGRGDDGPDDASDPGGDPVLKDPFKTGS